MRETVALDGRDSLRGKAQSREQPIELLEIVELHAQSTTISLATGLDADAGAEMLAELSLEIVQVGPAGAS
jgi:hypothetical protein